MKKKIKIYGLFLIYTLFSWGCANNETYTYRSKEMGAYKKPVATVEKAWLARHKYDHERRLLIPMVGGSRWGAIQEYKEDGTLEYKDWWERDIKIEDLDPTPSTTLKIKRNKNEWKKTTLDGINVDNFVKPTLKDETEISNSVEEVTDFIPIVPDIDDGVEETGLEPPAFDSTPEMLDEGLAPADSPFAPLPDAFPPLELPFE
tara:strand:+ start:3476 stop:4084 length:609 start_codon:yes stop_codon:yes gene_type:complete